MLVVLEKSEFAYRDNFLKQPFLDSSSYQDFDARIKIKSFELATSSVNVELAIETFKEDIKPVVTEIYDFRYRDKLSLIAFSEKPDKRNFGAKNKRMIFCSTFLSKNFRLRP